MASLCHVAWGQVVARTSGREQVVFGTVLFGRMHGGAGRIGRWACSSTRCRCGWIWTSTGVEESVRQTHARLAELLRHEHASLALAQRCSGVAAPAPLFSALLNYRHNRRPTEASRAADGVRCDGVEWLGGAGAHELSADAVGGRLRGGAGTDGAGGAAACRRSGCAR